MRCASGPLGPPKPLLGLHCHFMLALSLVVMLPTRSLNLNFILVSSPQSIAIKRHRQQFCIQVRHRLRLGEGVVGRDSG